MRHDGTTTGSAETTCGDIAAFGRYYAYMFALQDLGSQVAHSYAALDTACDIAWNGGEAADIGGECASLSDLTDIDALYPTK